MVTNATADSQTRTPSDPEYIGVRCSADEYLELDDDGFRYQLINGVVIVSPGPTIPHQRILLRILMQMERHAELHGGQVLPEVDLRLAADLVYTPDIAFLIAGRASPSKKSLTIVPDLVVEIISPSTRRMDFRTKRADYERFGVREYWIVEPDEKRVRVLRLQKGAYVESMQDGPTAQSEVIPGFAFDLVALRVAMDA